MATISVPITAEQERFIADYIKTGKAETKAQVVRRALRKLSDEEAIAAVIAAQREPTLRGDLRALMRKIK